MTPQRRRAFRLDRLERRDTPATFFAETTDELIQAVIDANANFGADTIELTGRTYNFTDPFSTTESALPAIDLRDGNNLTIRAFDDTNTGTDDFRVAKFVRDSSLPFRFIEAEGRTALGTGTLTIDRVSFDGGTDLTPVEFGGAINLIDASLVVTRSTFVNNEAVQGAAIYVDNEAVIFDSVVISQTTFNQNAAEDSGGAVYLKGTLVTIGNSTFHDNDAENLGGALYLDQSISSIRFVTATNNTTLDDNSGSAIYVNGGSASIRYSVVTANGPDGIVSTVTLPIDLSMLSLESKDAAYQGQVKIAPTNSRFTDTPGLKSFGFYGGWNRTRLPDSEAKGDNSVIDLIPATVLLVSPIDERFDQRDQPRPEDDEGDADMGAVEFQPSENVGSNFGSDLGVSIAYQTTSLVPEETIQYTITVDNFGPIGTALASVSNNVFGITVVSWTRSDFVSPDGFIPDGGQKAGADILFDEVFLPSGSRVVYTVEATVDPINPLTGVQDGVYIWGYVTNQDDVDPDPTNNIVNSIIPVVNNPTTPGLEQNLIVAGADAGYTPAVRVYDPTNGNILADFLVYSNQFRGGVRTAAADFNGDGTADIVVAPGAGGGPHVRIYDGQTFQLTREFFAYDPRFTGGLYVSAGDVTGDGVPDIITGAGAGGGPNIRVFSGTDLSIAADFFAYGANFRGGVHVGSGDVNNDGREDIVVGPGAGGGPHVRVFDVSSQELRSLFAYDMAFPGGVWVDAGDFNRDGYADIVTGAGEGGGAHVKIFDGNTGAVLGQEFAFDARTTNRATTEPDRGFDNIIANDRFNEHKNGVRVAVTSDLDFDGRPEIVASSGPGDEPIVRIIAPLNVTGPDFVTLDTLTKSNNTPVAVAPFGTSSSRIQISGVTGAFLQNAAISDVNVRVSVQVADTRDLELFLVGPDGTRVELVAGEGDGGPNFIDTRFDDEATRSIKAGTAPFTGTFRPELPLSIFDGTRVVNGDWLLEVRNTTNNGPATILNWTLDIAIDSSATAVPLYDVYDFRALRDLNLLSPFFEFSQTSFGQTSPPYPAGRDSLYFPGYVNGFFGGIFVGAT